MGEILDRSLHIDTQIAAQYSTVETMRVMFEEVCPVMVVVVVVTLVPSNYKVSTFVLSQCLSLHTNKPVLTHRLIKMQSEKSGNQSNKCYSVL